MVYHLFEKKKIGSCYLSAKNCVWVASLHFGPEKVGLISC